MWRYPHYIMRSGLNKKTILVSLKYFYCVPGKLLLLSILASHSCAVGILFGSVPHSLLFHTFING